MKQAIPDLFLCFREETHEPRLKRVSNFQVGHKFKRMKNIFFFAFVLALIFRCGTETHKTGPDYSLLKPALDLTRQQEKQFDQITSKYSKLRHEAFAKARSGGKMNREAMMADMKRLFAEQGSELKPVLSEEQFTQYTEWLQKQLPGRVGWSPEIIAQIKQELALDQQKSNMVDAVNEAFIEAYIGAHDNYHGNNEAAKAYWTEFNSNRKAALKKVFSDEEYAKFEVIIKDVKYRGEHGKGE